MAEWNELCAELFELTRRAALLGSCGSVLSWDQETYMPAGGAEHRAAQLSLLAGVTHEWSVDRRIGELLDALAEHSGQIDPDSEAAANIREIRCSYERSTKLPRRLVEELSRVTALGQHHWAEARSKSDFSLFLPWLEQIVRLKREEASAVGFSDEGEAYDALLDEYEPGARTRDVAEVFAGLRERLVPLLRRITDSGRRPPVEILHRRYETEKQAVFAREAAAAVGFDFDRGRLDVTTHPFCSGFGPGDCRLTTRYDENFFSGAFFGTLHEAGHGLYEQGLRPEAFGTPCGTAASLGIHESQSRLWENLVGRSHAFWQHFFPKAQRYFPESLRDVVLDEFVFAVNAASPSLIRVEADEVTYNLHIMLRFDLERELISGSLEPADVPAVWNERFHRDLGLLPESDRDGCLQDVHWSAGLFGYFPTYALGNLCAAQLSEAADRELGGLSEMFVRGEFRPLLDWLRDRIHQHGQRYRAPDLIARVTGAPLSDDALMRHLEGRFGHLYAV